MVGGEGVVADSREPAVLALVPAHDEESRIGPVVRTLVAQGLPVLVVDDGSSDNTAEEARTAGARVLSLRPNRGKGAALKAGFRVAVGNRAVDGPAVAETMEVLEIPEGWQSPPDYRWDAILTLDGDGQHDPASVPAFLKAWRTTGADLVVGARDYRDMPPVRWFTNTVSRHLFSWALGTTIPDNQSGYRLRTRRLAEASLASTEQGFAFEVEEIAICVGRGYKLAWVPVATIYGTEVSDIKPWSHFTGFIRVTWRARKRMRLERSRTDGRVGAASR